MPRLRAAQSTQKTKPWPTEILSSNCWKVSAAKRQNNWFILFERVKSIDT
jgi:hypothetical protein